MTALAAAATGLAALGLMGTASASTSQAAAPATVSTAVCTIKAFDGHYLSAIGGGGRTTDVIETNRTVASTWETFTIVSSFDGASPPHHGIRTTSGNFLTAVGGGGRTTDVIHSNATLLQAWEKFTPRPAGHEWDLGLVRDPDHRRPLPDRGELRRHRKRLRGDSQQRDPDPGVGGVLLLLPYLVNRRPLAARS